MNFIMSFDEEHNVHFANMFRFPGECYTFSCKSGGLIYYMAFPTFPNGSDVLVDIKKKKKRNNMVEDGVISPRLPVIPSTPFPLLSPPIISQCHVVE